MVKQMYMVLDVSTGHCIGMAAQAAVAFLACLGHSQTSARARSKSRASLRPGLGLD